MSNDVPAAAPLVQQGPPVQLVRDALFNEISFSEYQHVRNPDFDVASLRRPGMELLRGVIPSYEYQMRAAGATAQLWSIVTKARDLLNLFNSARSFIAWYNQQAPSIEVNHPRELSFRCLSDMNQTKSEYGFFFAIENQTFEPLFLEDYIDWYGWSTMCLVPQIIPEFGTVFFDKNYSGLFYSTAAGAYRYRVGNTGWYAYIAAYTYRFGSNASYVKLSQNIIPWNDIYDSLTGQSSSSKSTDDKLLMLSTINWEYKAKAVCQLAAGEDADLLTKIDYYLGQWLTPQDYHDEM